MIVHKCICSTFRVHVKFEKIVKSVQQHIFLCVFIFHIMYSISGSKMILWIFILFYNKSLYKCYNLDKTFYKNCIWDLYFSYHIFILVYCYRISFSCLFIALETSFSVVFPFVSFLVPDLRWWWRKLSFWNIIFLLTRWLQNDLLQP